MTPAGQQQTIQLDNCDFPKNIRFYFSPIKALNTTTIYKRDHHLVDLQQHDSERNWMTTDTTGVNLKHLNNNLNNLAICCNSWKHVGLINVKKAAGIVSKINYND